MNRLSKSRDPDVPRNDFIETQMVVAAPAAFFALALRSLIHRS
jgi:hypothetical protein